MSSVDRLEDAHFGHASISSWREHGRGEQFDALAHRVWRSRGVGDFWMHVLVAEGVFDLAAEPIVSLWDLAAVKVIVEEAGGRFTDLSGVAGQTEARAVDERPAARRRARGAGVTTPSVLGRDNRQI